MSMTQTLNIGMIGLDTSHAAAFTKLLNDTSAPFHVPGGRIVAAYPGGSPDFELSWSRLERLELPDDARDVRLLVFGEPAHLIEVRQHAEVAQERFGLRLRRTRGAGQALVQLAAELVGTLLEIVEEAHAAKRTVAAVAAEGVTPTGSR